MPHSPLVPTPEAADLVRLTRTLAERELAPRAAEAEAGERFPRDVFRTLGSRFIGPEVENVEAWQWN